MTTSTRRHSRAPMRRSSGPERVVSAGLATATCIGVVGLLGARTIEANASSSEVATSSEAPSTDSSLTSVSTTDSPEAITTSTGLSQADLDAYAAELAAEAARLDAYRAKLVKTAKKLKRLAAAQAASSGAARAPAPSTTSGPLGGERPSLARPSTPNSPKASKPRPQQQAAQPAPQQQAAQPAPAPAAKAAPQQQAAQPAPQQQSTTKGS